jgi:glyoxylase-like metal-dependent hydrolase (beta-lactamase superfamily II)
MARVDLPGYDIAGITAANPGPFTLSGTNSWIVGRDPAWLVDPGPALREHVDALSEEIAHRGGLGGIALTHDHADHSEAVPAIRARFPAAKLAGARGGVDLVLAEGAAFGPFEVVATPGHAPDHLTFISVDAGGDDGATAFTGDAVLGEGSVFIAPYPGALAAYLDGLRRLQGHRLGILLPGHGPPVRAAAEKLDEYVAHRLDRERRLLAALAGGKRTVDELLDDVWADAPAALRPAAAWTLAAHLDKLDAEGRLPEGVQRPQLGPLGPG